MDNLEVISPTPEETLNFGIKIPKPFRLADQDKEELKKIQTEVMDKVTTWDRRISPFRKAYDRGADSWRIKPSAQKRSSKQLFNSKSGETHRAAETLATLWQRMITAQTPSFEAVKQGLNAYGQEITEEDLYAVEGVLQRQHQWADLYDKQLRSLRSLALMGTMAVELPYISRPFGPGSKNEEYTDWVLKPMSRFGFDTSVYNLRDSDFVFTIDFLTKWMLRNMASLDTEFWDLETVERHINDFKEGAPASSGVSTRLRESRTRAGYEDRDSGIFEIVNYHGRLETNPVMEAFAESVGLDIDPKFVDWTVSVLDEYEIGQFHMTQYGDWRTRFLTATYKDFEDEPLGYGICQLGRRLQRDMDINESNLNDLVAAFTHMMWKIGKYSGYSEKQMAWEPLKTIELEDISQLAPLTPDPNAFKVALEMMSIKREDFRNAVEARTNLQAEITKASATESGIAQNEAMRAAGVHAQRIAGVYRRYLELAHVNNTNYMDEPMWVGLTGLRKSMMVDKSKLPMNVGFMVKTVLDSDFRPERFQKLLELLGIETSIRNFIPPEISINAINDIHSEIWRTAGMNPRTLKQPVPLIKQMEVLAGRSPNGLPPEAQGEAAGAGAGGGANVSHTPVGPVLTSPTNNMPVEMSA